MTISKGKVPVPGRRLRSGISASILSCECSRAASKFFEYHSSSDGQPPCRSQRGRSDRKRHARWYVYIYIYYEEDVFYRDRVRENSAEEMKVNVLRQR